MEKYTYISELSDTVVSDLGRFALTNAPTRYFQEPGLISLGVLIVDARHKPSADDVTMCDWFKEAGCPMLVVANKVDKLKKREVEPNLEVIRQTLELPPDTPLVPFSAEKGDGKTEVLSLLSQFFA